MCAWGGGVLIVKITGKHNWHLVGKGQGCKIPHKCETVFNSEKVPHSKIPKSTTRNIAFNKLIIYPTCHLIWDSILSELYSSPIICVILPQLSWILSSYIAVQMNGYMAFVFIHLLAFGLAPRFYKEIYKIPYPMSVLYVLLSDWLILAGVKVITLPRHWIKLSLLH